MGLVQQLLNQSKLVPTAVSFGALVTGQFIIAETDLEDQCYII